MNKKILFAAVGAALAVAPMISAQADVKVGGTAHVSLDSLDRDNSADKGSLHLSSNSSNFNISASEDLGGGMKALAFFEFLIAQDASTTSPSTTCTVPALGGTCTDTSGLANRNNYVGLQGGFGTVLMGHMDAPMKIAGRSVDLFYNEQLGESRAIVAQSNWDARLANGIRYSSNATGGLSFMVHYAVEDQFATDYTTLSAGLTYKAGPLMVGGAYKKIEGATDLTGTRLVGSYKMGDIKITGFYQDVDVSATANRTTMGLGAALKAGNNTFKAQWYQADETVSGANNGGSQLSLGIDHALSKNTIVYVTHASTSNDTSGTFGIGGSGHGASATPAAGQDASGLSLGMRMKF